MLADIEIARRMIAYRDTSSDREAALLLGISPGGFASWRRARGLPSRAPNRHRTDREILARVRVLMGCDSIGEAAASIGVSVQAVWDWMRRHDIPRPRNWSGAGRR